ncbi:MAG: N-acetyltransferase [Lewinellaceae bacterium]|nr:N-acetyltransferase [Saprospiraceae bacterium]MCB9316197.1 N-acetyltransferase [Lewinellaceae bacterium]MCB9329619.1 N-acetyltransferase [Lewinellaceae bacterium]
MQIQFEINGHKGAFFIAENGERLAAMEFTMAGEHKMIIDHTEVDDRLRGKSAGRQLLNNLVEYVREKNIKVIPLCPFAKSVFQKDESIRDVLV